MTTLNRAHNKVGRASWNVVGATNHNPVGYLPKYNPGTDRAKLAGLLAGAERRGLLSAGEVTRLDEEIRDSSSVDINFVRRRLREIYGFKPVERTIPLHERERIVRAMITRGESRQKGQLTAP